MEQVTNEGMVNEIMDYVDTNEVTNIAEQAIESVESSALKTIGTRAGIAAVVGLVVYGGYKIGKYVYNKKCKEDIPDEVEGEFVEPDCENVDDNVVEFPEDEVQKEDEKPKKKK